MTLPQRTTGQIKRLTHREIGSEYARAGREWFSAGTSTIVLNDEKLNTLLPRAYISSWSEARQTAPFLFIGPKSDLCRFFGTEIGSEISSAGYFPDHDYDRKVSATYREVLETDQPCSEYVVARMSVPGFDRAWIAYERTMVPAYLSSGLKVIVTFSDAQRILWEPGTAL